MSDLIGSLFAIFFEIMNNSEIIYTTFAENSMVQFYAMGLAVVVTCLLVAIPVNCCFRLVKWGLNW